MLTIAPYYPGFVRKAITFSIDDGNIKTDEKFLSFVRPAGIKGTFNLCSHTANLLTPEAYRKMYEGYEIANHCKYHPYAFKDGESYQIREILLDEATADRSCLYQTGIPHVYAIRNERGWRTITDAENYIKLVKEGKAELERIFGEGSIHGFVWPFHPPENRQVLEYVASAGYEFVRAVFPGGEGASRRFALPQDLGCWVYTATHSTLDTYSREYAAYPDDGELKFFCIGVHSTDYEREHKWDVLSKFCADFGNQPDQYWYATNHEIFRYSAALKLLHEENAKLVNTSDVDLYLSVNGDKCIIPSQGKIG